MLRSPPRSQPLLPQMLRPSVLNVPQPSRLQRRLRLHKFPPPPRHPSLRRPPWRAALRARATPTRLASRAWLRSTPQAVLVLALSISRAENSPCSGLCQLPPATDMTSHELGRKSLAQAMPQTPGGTAINDLGADDAPQA